MLFFFPLAAFSTETESCLELELLLLNKFAKCQQVRL